MKRHKTGKDLINNKVSKFLHKGLTPFTIYSLSAAQLPANIVYNENRLFSTVNRAQVADFIFGKEE